LAKLVVVHNKPPKVLPNRVYWHCREALQGSHCVRLV
jgi:hypothetical protein